MYHHVGRYSLTPTKHYQLTVANNSLHLAFLGFIAPNAVSQWGNNT